MASYERSSNGTLENRTAFPAIPDQNTFVNLGLNKRPTFFGCNASNSSIGAMNTAPLIVYLPNAPYTIYSNLSTFNLSYADSTRNGVITNGFNVATRGNSSTDMWPTCVGCAILQRSMLRTGTAMPQVCADCFTAYCWNGTIDATTPPAYEPTLAIASASASSTKNSAPGLLPQFGMFAVTITSICLAVRASI